MSTGSTKTIRTRFNPTTTIKYDLPARGREVLTVYDVLGRRVRHMDEEKAAGYHTITFDANALSSGMYVYRLEAGDYVETKRMVVVK